MPCRRQRTLRVTLPYRGSPGPLNLLAGSAGIEVRGEGERPARKHGAARRRVWRLVRLGIDEATMEVRAIESEQANAIGPREPASGSHVGDAPVLPDLLGQTCSAGSSRAKRSARSRPAAPPIRAYGARRCHDAIAVRGAHAVVPPRKNARPCKPGTPGARARMEALRASKHLGRASWRRSTGYHRRSRAETETETNCVKPLGRKLRARDCDRQTAERRIRVAILNRLAAIGIPVTRPVS